MRKLIYLLALWAPLMSAQCDVELSNVNWETGEVQIVVHNSDNCGIYWGVPWIDHINLGVSNGIDTLCIPCQNFPLHSFLNFDEQHFGDGIGDNFPRKFGDTPSPPSTNQEANRAGAGVTAGTPAAVDPNADGVATRQQGTEDQRQATKNNMLEQIL